MAENHRAGAKGPLSSLPPRAVSPGGGGGGKKLGKLGKPALKGKAGKSGGVGGCPRSLKQSEASGSKAEGPPLPPPPVVEVSREVEEAAEPELVLPRFMCPSSETKSRQAALKHWLAHSSFQEAVRTVPMV